MNAVMACIESMHSLLDVFLSLDLHSLRTVPIVIFVRMSYSIVVLIKLHISTYSREVGKVLDRSVLNVNHYLEACMEKLKAAAGVKKHRIPNKWLSILRDIGGWYHKYDDAIRQKESSSSTEMAAINWLQAPNGKCPQIAQNMLDQSIGALHYSLASSGTDKNSGDNVATPDADMSSEPLAFSTTGQTTWVAPNENWSSAQAASLMGGFDSFGMDFTPNDFSFLEQPNELDRNAAWMTENMILEDINFDPSGGNWSTQYTGK